MKKMDRVRLVPFELPASSVHSSGKNKISFLRRLTLGFIVLAALGLLYVPAYHSVQGPLSNFGELLVPAGQTGNPRYAVSVAQLKGWGYNVSRDIGHYIIPENSTSILSPTNVCSFSPYLLIVVCSAVDNSKARTAIRNTWANQSLLDELYNSTVKVVFLLGESKNVALQSSVESESAMYSDIIQERFRDSYNNLTLKSAMLLKWVTRSCDQVQYIMKTDDDMYVNVPILLSTLKNRTQVSGTLMGSLICNARPISDSKNKWYMPKYMYSERTYPNYLSGTGYVMSLDVASRLYETALQTPLLYLEDVYITGLCAKRAKLRPVNHSGFSYIPRKLDTCSLKSAITAHKVSTTSMYNIWVRLNDSSVVCHSSGHKRATALSRTGRNVFFKRRVINKCV